MEYILLFESNAPGICKILAMKGKLLKIIIIIIIN